MLNLSPAQMAKLRNKHPVQIRHDQIGHGLKLHLPKGTVKALEGAVKKAKGVRISLDDDTIKINGEGLGRSMKKAGKFFKKVGKVTKPIYKVVKPIVSPLVHEAAKEAVQMGLSSYGYDVPDVVTDRITDSALNQAGLGLRGRRYLRGRGIALSPLLPYDHPAMHPMKKEIIETGSSNQLDGGMILPKKMRKGRLPKGMVSIQGGSFLNPGY